MESELLQVATITPTEAQAVIVTTKDEYVNAGDVLKFIKDKIKKIEAKRIEHTSKLLEQKRIIDKDYKDAQKPLQDLADKINSAMVNWNMAEQKRLDEEQRKIEDAILAEEEKKEKERLEREKETGIKETPKFNDIFVPVVNDIKKVKGNMASNVMAQTYDFELVDISKVPLDFLTTDDVKIKKALRDSKGKVEISGIKVVITNKINSHRGF